MLPSDHCTHYHKQDNIVQLLCRTTMILVQNFGRTYIQAKTCLSIIAVSGELNVVCRCVGRSPVDKVQNSKQT